MCFLSHYKKYCIVVCNYHCVATRSESVHFYGVAFILEGDTFLMPKNLKRREKTKMSDEAKTALCTLIAAVISAVVSWLVAKKTIRYNYKELFAETVSQSRNKWLNEMRAFISSMLAEAKRPSEKSTDNRTTAYWKARNQIMLRLNLNEEDHILLNHYICLLDNCDDSEKDNLSEKIIDISNIILKEEWEKVKKEAKGE